MKGSINTIFIVVAVTFIGACSKHPTDYRQYLGNNEIIYPGIVADLQGSGGNERVRLSWHPSPDPSINKYLIYWDNGADSLVVNAASHNPLDLISVYIDSLKEYMYSFSMYSIDGQNNKSIAVSTSSIKVYGPLYIGGLLNRPFNNTMPSTFDGNAVTLHFNTPDTINITTEIKYTSTDGTEKQTYLSPQMNSITLQDYKLGLPVLYRSSYVPTVGAADTFYTAKYDTFPVIKDITSLYLKNAINPISPLETDISDRFRTPAYWTVNDAIKNKTGSSTLGSKMGGWASDDNGSILVTTDAPEPDVINGKIYQTIQLPAGKYSMKVDVGYDDYNTTLMVVAKGDSLPDITGDTPASETIAYADLRQKEVSFVLNKKATVSLGFITNNPSGYFWSVRSMSLIAQY